MLRVHDYFQYLQSPVHMVPYKGTPIMRLSLDIERRQGFIKRIDKRPFFRSEPFLTLSS